MIPTTWTYSGDPSASNLDEVRFIIGDTDENDPLLSNEEIMYRVNADGGRTVTAAAILCCDDIVAQTAKKMDKSLGPLSLSYVARHENYIKLAKRLRATNSYPIPLAAGLFPDKTDDKNDNPDSVVDQWAKTTTASNSWQSVTDVR